MRTKLFPALAALLLGATLLATAPPAKVLAPEAAARTQSLLAAFGRVPPPDAAPHAQRTSDAELDGFFDLDSLCARAIAPHRQALSGAQMKRFLRDFRALVRAVAYGRAAGLIKRAKVAVAVPVAVDARQRVVLHIEVSADDLQSELAFVWGPAAAGPARIVDVEFDGASFLTDYQNQFGRLLKKDGPEGLLKKLAARLAQAPGTP